MVQANGPTATDTTVSGRGWLRWLILLIVLAVAALALGQLFSPTGERPGVTGARVAPYLLGPQALAGVAAAPAGAYRQTSPPVDLPQAERLAAQVGLGQVPLPDDREIVTYRRTDTGDEVTQLVLLYDDPSAAERLDGLAATKLAGLVGLQSEETALAGAQDARAWRAESYRAVSFRRGGVAVFVGMTTRDPRAGHGGVLQLAAAVLARIQAQPPPEAGSPTAVP